jgi:PAS domain S-box-containing protein
MMQKIINLPGYLFGNQPTWQEISAVFNLLPEAALLFNRESREILFANRKFLELTAFTLQEIVGKPYSKFLPDYKPAFWDAGETLSTHLVRRIASSTAVKVDSVVLDEGANWILLKLSETVYMSYYDLSSDEQINLLMDLIKNGDVSDEQQLYDLVLEALKSLLGTDLIGIYRGDSLRPQAVRVAMAGDEVFPPVLSSADVIRLSEAVIWKPGKRMFTELHRQGRIAGLKYVASVPIGHREASLGLLVVGDMEREPIDKIGKILDFFHFYIGYQLQKLALIENLSAENQKKGFSLSVLTGILEHIDEGVVVLTPTLKVIEINSNAEVLLGYSCTEVCGERIENVLIGSIGLIKTLEDSVQSLKTHTITKTSLHRRDGSAFPAEMQVIPVVEDGHARALLVLIVDVSEEEENRLRTEQLENHAMLGEFTAIFAHEVRNPINNISTGLQLLANKAEGDIANLDLIERAQNDCIRLNELMDSVLAFSRPIDHKFQSVDVSALVQRVVNRWRPRMTRVNIEPYFKAAEDLPVVSGDYRSLERVFTNLISNAVDVMSGSGGTLSVRVGLKEVVNQQPHVEITFADNGPGIPDSMKDRIFEPFVSNKPRGTGLGLAITKQIVTTHRGAIYASSFPGGTVFHVELPVAIDGEKL